MSNFNASQIEWIAAANKAGFKAGSEISRAEIKTITESIDAKPPWWFLKPEYKAGRGIFVLPASDGSAVASSGPAKPPKTPAAKALKASAAPVVEQNVVKLSKASSVTQCAIPKRFRNYVPFGFAKDLGVVLASEQFYPVFIAGLSGNGKTLMVEQACAKAKRELFRVNITIETDEDDLLGGFRLFNGETVWFDGPVIEAMRRGAVLLLDEVDLASNKIMCLQPILEGKPILLKKINEIVSPAPGFTMIATGNTKGKGSEDGNFVGTNILNEAFLERWAILVEQEYPPAAIEKRIVAKELKDAGRPDIDFAGKLTDWAQIVRKAYDEGAEGIDEVISTRRLVHIAKAFGIFDDRLKAIHLCLNRFDDETKEAFIDLYTKVDAAPVPEAIPIEGIKADDDDSVNITPF